MGRTAKPYRTKLTRVMLRKEYHDEMRTILSKLNLFDPSKPEHGAISNLTNQLLYDWLKARPDVDQTKLPAWTEKRIS